jgi:glycosyltransferase involved in cell wall biosynthesis
MALLKRSSSPPPMRIPVPRALLEFRRSGGAAPLDGAAPGESLRIAVVVPQFRRGSGGHKTIADIVRGLEARGHAPSIWVEDEEGRHHGEDVDDLWHSFFGRMGKPVRLGFDEWDGADVVLATGWQTVHRSLLLPRVAARAYLVQDHEPEFFGTSVQRAWAEDSYRHDLYAITAGQWLAETMREEHGLPATSFDLGINAERWAPQPEVARREIWLYGHSGPMGVDFPHRSLGMVPEAQLPVIYAQATVGLVLSMTNYSLVAQEMLACGLPCVELDAPSVVQAFGRDGPVDFAPLDPVEIAAALERLLDDPALRARRAEQGARLRLERSWDHAAEQVEAGLRAAIAHAHREEA